jgi:TolB protein
MRKLIAFLIFLIPLRLGAEIYVDIDAGQVKPINIAILKMKSQELDYVVENDLKRSGVFRPLNPSSFIDKSHDVSKSPVYENWDVIGAQLLLAGKITTRADGRLGVEYALWDVPSRRAIIRQTLITEKNNLRRIGHIIADAVYSAVTGDKGYFDTRIVYIAETGSKTNRVKRLAIMDQDGANLKYLTSGKIQVTTPAFSPNSQKIAYVTYYKGVPRVYIFDIETGEQELLGTFPGMSFAPRFSPDGEYIVMSLANEGNSDIYEIRLKDKRLSRLTSHLAIDTAPSYSPDGKKIAFVSDRSGSPQIYTMGRSGKNVRRASQGKGQYGDVAWSPRGDYLGFTKVIDNRFLVGVMFEDGSGERSIASGYTVESPTFSPNGRRIIFYEETPESDRLTLHSVDVSGYNHEAIKTPTNASDPAWSPLLE